MAKIEPTPWRRWLEVAARLGVPPAAFWALSLREWRALVAPHAIDVLSRTNLDALAARFPDAPYA